jgi:hypothetical protein
MTSGSKLNPNPAPARKSDHPNSARPEKPFLKPNPNPNDPKPGPARKPDFFAKNF